MTQSHENESTTYRVGQIQTVAGQCLGVSYHSRRRQQIYDVCDRIVGESSILPIVYIQDKIAQMREAPVLSFSQRYKCLKKASHYFQEATLAGLDPTGYVTLVSNVTGLQPAVVTASLAHISQSLDQMQEIIQAAAPTGSVWNISAPEAKLGCSLFSRRADVVAIIAAGNGPGVHGLWPQAIALGYRTLVRPSSREPFTAQRLVCALEKAGLAHYVALVPTDHKGAEFLISHSDLSIVYGGERVVSHYAKNPRVLVQGPGRSKILVGKDISHDEAVEVAAHSVLALGGAACVSTSAILVEDNHVAFAKKLKQTLETHAQHQALTLARRKDAEIYEDILKLDEPPWAYDHSVTKGCRLIPQVTIVDNASDPKVQRELPFPCVTVAPFHQEKSSYKALSGSLVVTVLSRQEDMINKVILDASIANVYIGNIPTTDIDFKMPHDGYLADFLMCNRGVRVSPEWSRLG